MRPSIPPEWDIRTIRKGQKIFLPKKPMEVYFLPDALGRQFREVPKESERVLLQENIEWFFDGGFLNVWVKSETAGELMRVLIRGAGKFVEKKVPESEKPERTNQSRQGYPQRR